MSWLQPILSVFRPTPRRCRANAWASVYAEVYDVETPAPAVEARENGDHDE